MAVLIGIFAVVHNVDVQLAFAVSAGVGVFVVEAVALGILVVQYALQQPAAVERLVYVPLVCVLVDDVVLLDDAVPFFAAKRLVFVLLDGVAQLGAVGLFAAGYFHEVSVAMPLVGAGLFANCSDYSQRAYRGR